MNTNKWVGVGAMIGAVAFAASAQAAPFSCPKKGGDLVFAGEAKINSLDQPRRTRSRRATSR